MAVRFTSASIQRLDLAAAPDYGQPYTVLFWVRFATAPTTGILFNILGGSQDFDRVGMQNNAGSVVFAHRVMNGGQHNTRFGLLVPTAGPDYIVGMVRESATVSRLYEGTSPATLSSPGTNPRDVSVRVPATGIRLGTVAGTPTAAVSHNGTLSVLKIWSGVAHGLATLQREAELIRPAITDNLFALAPLLQHDDLGVFYGSEQGSVFTATNGPLTTEKNPAIPWGNPVRHMGMPPAAGAATVDITANIAGQTSLVASLQVVPRTNSKVLIELLKGGVVFASRPDMEFGENTSNTRWAIELTDDEKAAGGPIIGWRARITAYGGTRPIRITRFKSPIATPPTPGIVDITANIVGTTTLAATVGARRNITAAISGTTALTVNLENVTAPVTPPLTGLIPVLKRGCTRYTGA